MSFRNLSTLLILTLTATVSHAQWVQTNGPFGTATNSLAMSGSALLAGTTGGIFRSTDSGAVGGLASIFILSMAVRENFLFAGTRDSGVSRSSDRGDSWTRVSSGLPGPTVYALAVSGSSLFACINSGVFRSTDNGATWTEFNTGMAGGWVHSFAVIGNQLFAGTGASGVVRRPVAEVSTGVRSSSKNGTESGFGPHFKSLQRIGESIAFTVKQRTAIHLSLYDTRGKEAATLVNSVLPAGTHQVQLDETVSGGMYFLRLQTGRTSHVRRIVLGE